MGMHAPNLFSIGLSIFGAAQIKKIYSETVISEAQKFLQEIIMDKYQMMQNYEECNHTLDLSNR